MRQLRNTAVNRRKIMSIDGQVITRFSSSISREEDELVVGYNKTATFFNKLQINGENLKDTDTSGNSVIH